MVSRKGRDYRLGRPARPDNVGERPKKELLIKCVPIQLERGAVAVVVKYSMLADIARKALIQRNHMQHYFPTWFHRMIVLIGIWLKLAIQERARFRRNRRSGHDAGRPEK